MEFGLATIQQVLFPVTSRRFYPQLNLEEKLPRWNLVPVPIWDTPRFSEQIAVPLDSAGYGGDRMEIFMPTPRYYQATAVIRLNTVTAAGVLDSPVSHSAMVALVGAKITD
jgi:hypothetical protein